MLPTWSALSGGGKHFLKLGGVGGRAFLKLGGGGGKQDLKSEIQKNLAVRPLQLFAQLTKWTFIKGVPVKHRAIHPSANWPTIFIFKSIRKIY